MIEARLAQARNGENKKGTKLKKGSAARKGSQPSNSYSGPRGPGAGPSDSYGAPGGEEEESEAASSYNAPGGPGLSSARPPDGPEPGVSNTYKAPGGPGGGRAGGLPQPETEPADNYNSPGGPGRSGGPRVKATDSYNAPGGPGRSGGPEVEAGDSYGAPRGPGRSDGPEPEEGGRLDGGTGRSKRPRDEVKKTQSIGGLYSAPSGAGEVEATDSYDRPGGPGAGQEEEPSGVYGAPPGESIEASVDEGLGNYKEGSGESSGQAGSGESDPGSYEDLDEDYGGTLPIEENFGGPSGEGDTNVFQGGINDIYESPSASEDYGAPTDGKTSQAAESSYLGPGEDSSGEEATAEDDARAGYGDGGEEGSVTGEAVELSGYQDENLKNYQEDLGLDGYEGNEASGGKPVDYEEDEESSGQGEYSGQGGQGEYSGQELVEEYSGGSFALLPPPSGRRGRVSLTPHFVSLEKKSKSKVSSKSKVGLPSKSTKATKPKSERIRQSKPKVETMISRKGKELRQLRPPSSKNRLGPRIRSVNYHYY